MPPFVLIFEDDLSVPMREDIRAEHTRHFTSLGERAILGGPTFTEAQEVNGRVLVADFPSIDEARAWAASEPLVATGRVKSWRAAAMVIVQDRGKVNLPTGHGG